MSTNDRPTPQVPIFVISSGRTGSTLLARLIHRHPRLLCISDLFEPVGDVPYLDRSRQIDGKEFFRILSAPSYPDRARFWRQRGNAELLYLHDDDDMVSLLLSYTLPFVAGGDPMALFAELREAAEGRGDDTPAGHTEWFFDWLRDRFGKDLWIERTGGSLPHTRKILETWPDAKIVHNFRDTRETAISMMKGSFFRLYLELTKNPDLERWDFDYMPPIEEMGAMLNGWIVDAMAALGDFPPERKRDLRFEDLLSDPKQTLLDFACFVLDRETPSDEDVRWAEKECKVIRKPRLKFPRLEAGEQERLTAACREGMELLGYA